MNGEEIREELEHEADVARARLLGTIDALDRRRNEMLDWKLQVRRHAGTVAVAGGGVFAAIAVTTGVVLLRVNRRNERLRRERWRALSRFWEHPERLATRRRTALGTATRTLMLTLSSLVALIGARVARRVIGRVRSRPRLPAAPVEALGV
ncbi:MAG TPA: hypothetical protein VF881_13320 [Polyangiaceae bacterium]